MESYLYTADRRAPGKQNHSSSSASSASSANKLVLLLLNLPLVGVVFLLVTALGAVVAGFEPLSAKDSFNLLQCSRLDGLGPRWPDRVFVKTVIQRSVDTTNKTYSGLSL